MLCIFSLSLAGGGCNLALCASQSPGDWRRAGGGREWRCSRRRRSSRLCCGNCRGWSVMRRCRRSWGCRVLRCGGGSPARRHRLRLGGWSGFCGVCSCTLSGCRLRSTWRLGAGSGSSGGLSVGVALVVSSGRQYAHQVLCLVQERHFSQWNQGFAVSCVVWALATSAGILPVGVSGPQVGAVLAIEREPEHLGG